MRYRAFLILSLDGHAAGPGDDLEWHEPYFGDFGPWYREFIATIGTVVMGRTTFDKARGIEGWDLAGGTWPGRDTYVLTSRPLDPPTARVFPWHEGAEALAGHLAAASPEGDTWVMGGPATLAAFQSLGLVGRYDLFIVPRLLGGGTPWSRGLPAAIPLTLGEHRVFPSGLIHLAYEPAYVVGTPDARPGGSPDARD